MSKVKSLMKTIGELLKNDANKKHDEAKGHLNQAAQMANEAYQSYLNDCKIEGCQPIPEEEFQEMLKEEVNQQKSSQREHPRVNGIGYNNGNGEKVHPTVSGLSFLGL
ncbi:MAG: hypothetical protein IPP74_07860 [Alphaproteobacteria bacterium]|nr:hypothetical protein [Alphaproteobacteria bacterium]